VLSSAERLSSMTMTMTFLARATAFAALVAMVAGNENECSANGDESCSADRTTLLQAKVDITEKTFTKWGKDQCEDWCDKEEGDCQWKDECGGCSFCGASPAAATPAPPTPAPPTPPPPTSGAKCEDWCDKANDGWSLCGQFNGECGGCSFCGAGPAPAPPPPPTPTPPTPPSSSPEWNYKPMQWISSLSSSFDIQPCAQIKNANGDLLPAQVRQTLASEQKTKCMQVFGALIAGTAGADSNAMRYSANIIAQLLDPNCDGTVDDPNVAAKLDKFKIPAAGWINYGTDAASEESTLDGSFSAQVWKADANLGKPTIALEEAFHMVHQMGWAEVYPDAFGFKDWGHNQQSVACRCMREAQCLWYQHPENGGCIDINGKKCYNKEVTDVFKSDTIPGTCATSIQGCSNPSCDCMEFFHKVETTWLGNAFSGYDRMGPKLQELQGQGLTQRAAVEKLLSQSNQCSQLLQHMKDTKMALPKVHVKETYQCGR